MQTNQNTRKHRCKPIRTLESIGANQSEHSKASVQTNQSTRKHRCKPIRTLESIGANQSEHSKASVKTNLSTRKHRCKPIRALESIGANQSERIGADSLVRRHIVPSSNPLASLSLLHGPVLIKPRAPTPAALIPTHENIQIMCYPWK